MKEPLKPGLAIKLVPTSDKRMLWYKGKYLHPDLIDDYEDLYYVTTEAEDLLDFEASQLPDEFDINITFPETKCLHLLTGLALERDVIKCELTFLFWFVMDPKPYEGELNYLKVKERLSKLINKAGYKVSEDPEGMYPKIQLLPEDNILAVYQKHLAVFEKFCRQIEKETIKRLSSPPGKRRPKKGLDPWLGL